MRRLPTIVLAFALAAAPLIALAQQAPPVTVNSPQSNNNGVSNPVGQNTNVQVNNSYAGMNSFGVGIECATPYLAAGLFNNNTTVGGGAAATSNANNNSVGATLQYVLPVGGKQQTNCTALSSEILHQHQLDTQITLIQRCADFAKAGITLDSRVYPELAAACVGVHVAVTATPTVGQLPTAAPAVQTVTVPKLVVYREPAPPASSCRVSQRATAQQRHLAQAIENGLREGNISKARARILARQLQELQAACLSPLAMARALAAR